MTILTLLTDFGDRDYYVAAVKGVVLGLAPGTQIVDISHRVEPGDLREASFLLAAAAPSFPPGTVHLAVVDPGVGSARRILVAAQDGMTFVAPDNGLLTSLLPAATVTEVTRSELFRPGHGQTFHGRDRFAPVAAALLRGEDPAALGRPLHDFVLLPLSPPRRAANLLAGHVVHIDRYGNLVTDIPASWLPDRPASVKVGVHATHHRATHYAEIPDHEAAVLEGSLGTLELSTRGEDLAARWGAQRGAAVTVTWSDGPQETESARAGGGDSAP